MCGSLAFSLCIVTFLLFWSSRTTCHSPSWGHRAASWEPDCNSTADVLLSLCALLSQQSHLFLICVALTDNDSRILLHTICQILRNCLCKWLLVSSSAPGTSLGSSGFLEKFLCYMGGIVTTELPNLVPPRPIDDCYAIHFLHWGFGDTQWSNHHNFPLWARLFQHVFCKTPSLFSSSSRYRNLGLSESECRHYTCPNPVPLLLAAPLAIHEKNWKCLDP